MRGASQCPVVDGGQPFWSRDGKELFYNAGPGQISAVNVTTRPNFAFSEPLPMPQGLAQRNPSVVPRNSDISSDGIHLIGVMAADQPTAGVSAAPQIRVVLDWLEELKQRVPVK